MFWEDADSRKASFTLHKPYISTMDMMNQLPVDTVHIWHLHQQSLDDCVIEEFMGTLSTNEKQKALGFRFEKDRRLYSAGRGCLRMLMGRYLAEPPSRIQFDYSQYGKPYLNSAQNKSDLRFSVSHSGDFVVYSFFCGHDIGIDIEAVKPIREFESVAENALTEKEYEKLKRITLAQQTRKFYEIWTIKEAYSKAIGLGLNFSFKNIEVLVDTNEPYQISAPQNNSNHRWLIESLSIDPDHVANVVIDGGDLELSASDIRIQTVSS